MTANIALILLLAVSPAPAEIGAEAEAKTEAAAERILGMSILGNQEAPKSLVIVPWKSSEIGESLGISTMLDDSRQPVDREVFLRALSYYEIRSETMPPPGSGSVVLVDGND
jgi:hypothetical protein